MKVGIIGDRGNLGKKLVSILREKHPFAEIVYTSNTGGSKGNFSEADVFFLAMGHGESKKYLPSIEGRKVIDLSADHRTADGWVYGLTEINREMIKAAEKVANPGCYATAILNGLLPVREIASNVTIVAYSGVSGRPGQKVIENGGIERYARGREHFHVPEIEKCLGQQITSFEPHIVYPLWTGIVALIKARLETSSGIGSLFRNAFEGEVFIRLTEFQPVGEVDLNYLTRKLSRAIDTNLCEVSFRARGNEIEIISSLDNLVKGGAGQAVQNLNLMYGLPENTGLL